MRISDRIVRAMYDGRNAEQYNKLCDARGAKYMGKTVEQVERMLKRRGREFKHVPETGSTLEMITVGDFFNPNDFVMEWYFDEGICFDYAEY